ncbi:MAG: hypothetical protein ACTTIR_07795 [Eggerthia catenaformis]
MKTKQIYLMSSPDLPSLSRAYFFRNGLFSRLIAYWNKRLGQNWVKISKRINPIIVSSGFTRKYKN